VHDFLATGQRKTTQGLRKREANGGMQQQQQQQRLEGDAYEGREEEVRRPVWRWAVGGGKEE